MDVVEGKEKNCQNAPKLRYMSTTLLSSSLILERFLFGELRSKNRAYATNFMVQFSVYIRG